MLLSRLFIASVDYSNLRPNFSGWSLLPNWIVYLVATQRPAKTLTDCFSVWSQVHYSWLILVSVALFRSIIYFQYVPIFLLYYSGSYLVPIENSPPYNQGPWFYDSGVSKRKFTDLFLPFYLICLRIILLNCSFKLICCFIFTSNSYMLTRRFLLWKAWTSNSDTLLSSWVMSDLYYLSWESDSYASEINLQYFNRNTYSTLLSCFTPSIKFAIFVWPWSLIFHSLAE